jgi:phospho-N-acetylmuramoyl-pentapeptide-transferase
VRGVLISAAVGLVVSILLTPYLIRSFSDRGFGQEIREEGPKGHRSKRGTPTMGGVAILVAVWAGYLAAHVMDALAGGVGPTASGLLVLALMTALGLVGFLDDFIKVRKTRNLGLNKTAKTIGLLGASIAFGILALQFPGAHGLTPASEQLSFVRDITVVSLTTIGFVVFAVFAINAWSNAVNLTDGLDGLAGGSSAMVLATYVVITIFQSAHDCFGVRAAEPGVSPCATRSTWRWWPPRRSARARASCGGTRLPPRSSWGTRARSRSVGCSRGCPSARGPSY